MAQRTLKHSAAALGAHAVGLGLCCALLGCAPARPAAEPVREHWVPGYVFGIWGRDELDVRDDCPTAGAARVHIGATWSTLLVSFVTLGIYTPREVLVHCRALP